MKNLLLPILIVLGLAISSCEKEPLPQPQPNPYALLADEQPDAVANSIVTFDDFMDVDVTESTDAKIIDYPSILDYDAFSLVTVRTLDSCLKNIEVTKAEKEQLSIAFKNKIACQQANKMLLSKFHREIEAWAKTQKENYYKNWYLVERGKLEYDLKMGVITQTQYKEKIAALEKTWASKMIYLNNQVKEKVRLHTERATAAGKIKDCEKEYLFNVMVILGEKRYKMWIACHKNNYKHKK